MGRGRPREGVEEARQPAILHLTSIGAIVRDGFAHGDACAPEDRIERRQQRHQDPNCHLDEQYLSRQRPPREIDVDEAAQEAGNAAGHQHCQGYGNRQRGQAVDQHRAQIHPDNLVAARADGLHDADLAHLLRQQRRNGVDDQETTQHQRQQPQRRQQQGERVEKVLERQLARLRHLHAPHGDARPFHLVCHRVGDAGDVILVELLRRRAVDPQQDLVIVPAPAQPLHGVEGNVAGRLAREGGRKTAGIVDRTEDGYLPRLFIWPLQRQGAASLHARRQRITRFQSAALHDDLIFLRPGFLWRHAGGHGQGAVGPNRG